MPFYRNIQSSQILKTRAISLPIPDALVDVHSM